MLARPPRFLPAARGPPEPVNPLAVSLPRTSIEIILIPSGVPALLLKWIGKGQRARPTARRHTLRRIGIAPGLLDPRGSTTNGAYRRKWHVLTSLARLVAPG